MQHSRPWFLPLITVVAVAVSIVGAFLGSGAIGGTPISQAADGWLSADSTPLAPGTGAFNIWSVIYVGLIAYTVWQLSATARRSPRQRALRPWAILSALLNAAWIWMVQLGSLVASVLVIIALLLVLIRVLVIMTRTRPTSRIEALVTDGTFGLYLGWVCVATVANISAWLASLGATELAAWRPLSYAVIVVAAAIGIATAIFSRGKLAPALATSWGLAWIAVGRLDGGLTAADVAGWAVGAAVAVLVAAVVARLRPRAHGAVTAQS